MQIAVHAYQQIGKNNIVILMVLSPKSVSQSVSQLLCHISYLSNEFEMLHLLLVVNIYARKCMVDIICSSPD